MRRSVTGKIVGLEKPELVPEERSHLLSLYIVRTWSTRVNTPKEADILLARSEYRQYRISYSTDHMKVTSSSGNKH